MGTVVHHHIAVVVSGYAGARRDQYGPEKAAAPGELARHLHAAADAIAPGRVTALIGPLLNDFWCFYVAPDGSKEDWEESDEGDDQRNRIIELLDDWKFNDGSSPVKWLEIHMGDARFGQPGAPTITRPTAANDVAAIS